MFNKINVYFYVNQSDGKKVIDNQNNSCRYNYEQGCYVTNDNQKTTPQQKIKKPIYCMVSCNHTRKTFSTGIYILPEKFSPETKRVKNEKSINARLAKIETLVEDTFHENPKLTANQIKNSIKPKEKPKPTQKYYFLEELKKSIPDGNVNTRKNYWKAYSFLQKFINSLDANDIDINDISKYFLIDYANFVFSTCKKASTFNEYIGKTHFILKAFSNEIKKLKRNRLNKFEFNFDFFEQPDVKGLKKELRKKEKERNNLEGNLSEKKYHTIEEIEVIKENLDKYNTLKLYYFQILYGMAFVDVLDTDTNVHIQRRIIGNNSSDYLVKKRVKSSEEFHIKITPERKAILDKVFCKNGKIDLGNLIGHDGQKEPYKTYYYQLRLIEKQLGFKLNAHMPRHTFATLRRYEGYSDSEIGFMLGQSSIKTTQIYAKTTLDGLEKSERNLKSGTH